MVSQAYVSLKSAVLPVEKLAGGATPTVLLGYKSMSSEGSDDNSSDDEQHECPECGRFFGTHRGMKIHYGYKHEGSLAGVEVECANCGTTKNELPCRVERSERHFCDRECKSEWASKRSGSETPNWKGGRVEVECANCGETKWVTAYSAKRSERHFCDDECKGGAYAEDWLGEDNPLWKGGRVEVECANCGETKKVKPIEYKTAERHYCDHSCMGAWLQEHRSGESNPNWEGGCAQVYGADWQQQRRKALDRDGHECQVCGKGEDELGRKPDVHHIVPLRTFESTEKANRLDNLVTLCRGHHARWEGVPLKPQ